MDAFQDPELSAAFQDFMSYSIQMGGKSSEYETNQEISKEEMTEKINKANQEFQEELEKLQKALQAKTSDFLLPSKVDAGE